jgi:hypothetical protein
MSNQPRIKRTIAGREVELIRGRVYTTRFPVESTDGTWAVKIAEMPRNEDADGPSPIVIDGFTYSAALAFCAEFNDDTFEFRGRYW